MDRRTQVDTALALCKEVQAILRPELRLLVMSATLGPTLIDSLTTLLRPEPEAVAATDTDGATALRAPLVRSKGRSYPLTTHYAGAPAVGHGEMERCACPQPLATFAARYHPRYALTYIVRCSHATLHSIPATISPRLASCSHGALSPPHAARCVRAQWRAVTEDAAMGRAWPQRHGARGAAGAQCP
jgi:hypothetical protein